MLAYNALAKSMDKEGALEQSCVIVHGDASGEKVEAKPQKLVDGMAIMEPEENKQQPEAEAEEKDGLDDSFEDLEGEYMRNILEDELEQKQKNLLEE